MSAAVSRGKAAVNQAIRPVRHHIHRGELGPGAAALALLLVWIIFQSLDDAFLSPRNLTNLSVDIAGIGMIALGVVFVLLLGEIDVSVGAVSGLSAAVFAVLSVYHGVPEWAAAVLAVLCGAAMGALQGFVVAVFGVPSFAVTLAGLLGWSSLTFALLGARGTISLPSDGLIADLTNHYFQNEAAAYALAALGAALFLLVSLQHGRRLRAAGSRSRSPVEIAVRTAVIAAIGFGAAYVLNRFRGLPLALLVFLAVVVGLDYLLRRTPYGRKIYALGGNTEAARRAGINVTLMRVSVFTMSGTMAAVGGVFLASQITSVGQLTGSGPLVISTIAAAVIGGTSLFGGRGRAWSAVLGVLFIQSIASGMVLLNVQSEVQYVIVAAVLVAALITDSLTRRTQQAHGRL
ncbi:sugar ABC transporter permease [Streptomyces sp. ISL-36]|uniref:sugar ABC transporter permease n=1 Tax=Streptomyces sp. ISL-36 TaxID=2819182 RepID=UPI001BEB64C7|nr:sugar ABC transporter permease [Streptomyces sp. ISL-36]MBT2442722.1 sugar ABC transporter permease [Streptomyces sp. ISL-36]